MALYAGPYYLCDMAIDFLPLLQSPYFYFAELISSRRLDEKALIGAIQVNVSSGRVYLFVGHCQSFSAVPRFRQMVASLYKRYFKTVKKIPALVCIGNHENGNFHGNHPFCKLL